MPRMISTQNLMDRARRAANQEHSTFVLDAELLDLINAAVPELHDVLIAAYGEDYFHKTTSPAAFTPNLGSYALPADFYKLLGVDAESQPDNGDWWPLKRFGERERTLGESSLPSTLILLKYRLRGQNIFFAPAPSSALRYRVHYAPQAPVLLNTTFSASDVDFGADTITLQDNGLTGDHPLRFSVAAGSTLPAGLLSAVTYYAIVVDGNTLQVATDAGGAAVDLTDAGQGTITIMSMFDGVNGWEELIVLSAAIRMLAKEESEIRPLVDERDRLENRLAVIVDNRDAGEPEIIQDVQGDLPGEEYGGRWPPPL